MKTLTLTHQQESIRWKLLWSIVALYGSIVLGWIAYESYQPKLLAGFGLGQFALPLTILQAIIMVVTPPIAGKLGDRYRRELGHRLPIVVTGISLAAMVFMAVAFILLSQPGSLLKWLLPPMIIGWLIAMSVFTSPALSTIELFTPVDKLPRAVALLTIVGSLLQALTPVIEHLIDVAGAPLTFIVGGTAIFASGYHLQKNALAYFRTTDDREPPARDVDSPVKKSRIRSVFGMGILFGLTSIYLIHMLPKTLEHEIGMLVGFANANLMLVALLLLVALLSLPASSIVERIGLNRSLATGFAVAIAAAMIAINTSSQVMLIFAAIVYTGSFALLSVTTLPLAMEWADDRQKVYAIGAFFAGFALPEGVVAIVMSP